MKVLRTHSCALAPAHAHAQTQIHTRTYMHACTYAYAHAHAHAHAHARSNTSTPARICKKHQDLAPTKPFLKFLVVKGIVFFTFFQNWCISVYFHVFPPAEMEVQHQSELMPYNTVTPQTERGRRNEYHSGNKVITHTSGQPR